MEMHEELKRARKDMGFSQEQLAHIAGVQRRQIAALERGGNVTLNTLRRVMACLPNLQEFTIGYVKLKPELLPITLPKFDTEAFSESISRLTGILQEFNDSMKKIQGGYQEAREEGEEGEE